MYSSAHEAIAAQRMGSPLEEQIRRTSRTRRRTAGTIFRPASNRGEQL